MTGSNFVVDVLFEDISSEVSPQLSSAHQQQWRKQQPNSHRFSGRCYKFQYCDPKM